MASSSTSISYDAPTVGPSSSSSFSSVCYAYEVFLSFRGADIRKTFIDHLYAALHQRGIYTFKDDNRLRGGKSISDQLLKAIEQSRSAIVVFSKDYASSGWCLDELEKIMDCKDKLGLAVYPVFYDVDPSDVRRQTGTFGKGFAKAAKRKVDKADVWRKALRDAAALSGYDVQNTADGHESQCIKQIVKWFWDYYGNIFASFDENLIGIKSRVWNLVSLLGIRDSDDDVRMIGIWGMGGAGKTTVVTVAFDEISKQFDGASFIENIREVSQKFGLPNLQKNILSDILMEQDLNVSRVSQGTQMLRGRLGCKKVLIILDDVDHAEQLRALAGGPDWFGKGSRIIITTRDKQLLVAHGIDKLYKADLLDEYEADKLFNKYAFKKNNRSMEGYDELSLRVVRYASGLPLTLKVLGSFLCDRGTAEWTSTLERLANIPEDETFEKLKISYDGLQDIDKKIFLDIACLFNGWLKDDVVRMLHSCEFNPVIGLSNLEQKTLITFSDENIVQMHDLIQEMGRKIVTQDASNEPEKHSRLWRSKDISSVLEKNMGTEAIEAIVLRHNDQSPRVDAKAFESMKKLRILYLHYFWGRIDSNELVYLPDELRWLSWNGYPNASLPKSFQAQKLVGLEMQFSRIVQLWEGKKLLYKLKFLDLSFSKKLIRTPDVSDIPLETLVLCYCSSLMEFHPSIGDLQRLVSLDLSHCNNLVDLPETICRLKSLKKLNVTCCVKLTKLPENFGQIESLEELLVIGSGIMQLPTTIGRLQKLKRVSMWQCKGLMSRALQPLCGLSYLKELDLSDCGLSEKAIPDDIGMLSFLENLNLEQNEFASLPSSISQLSRLKILDLSWCKFLRALPDVPSSIAILKADGCMSLGCMNGLPEKCEWLWKLSLIGCSSLISCSTDHHNCHKEQQYSSSMSTRRSKTSTDERVYMAEPGNCPKHSKLTQVVTSMFLQGRALFNHQLSIAFSSGIMNPWMWFDGHHIIKGNRFVLELPPNWQKKSTGFAMCAAFHSERVYAIGELNISFSKAVNNKSVNILLSSSDHDWRSTNIWIGYLSFNLIRCSYEGVMGADLMDKATQLILTFHADGKAEFCAAHLVNIEDINVDSDVTAFSSSFPFSSGLLQQQQIDPNFAASMKVPCRKGNGTGNDILLDLGDWPLASF